MDQPRGTDDKPDTKEDLPVVSKKRKTVAVSKMTDQELHLSFQNLFSDHSGPLRHIVEFLDPGLDWPTCRKVSTSWHKCILLTEKKLDGSENNPSIWVGPVVLVNPTSPDQYKKNINKEFMLVRPTTEKEQNSMRQYTLENRGVRDASRPPLEPFQKWARTDGQWDEEGAYGVSLDYPAIVTAQVHLLCRNVYHLLEETDPDQLRSPFFSFAGTKWCAVLRYEKGDNSHFGVKLERWDPVSDSDQRCVCSDPAPPAPNSLTCAVLYNATFTALSEPIQKMRETYLRCRSYEVAPIYGEDFEYMDKQILQFALGPPPACPHLRITLDLEFLGYGYGC
mmetsp:Transcript_12527/g.30260  ORF Transcript_12527/g.30260 Transcript_12527/m.30260 type:complete len:336 (-) Transcript_12527:192-1199(-)|eukprot:CAMPEP_0113503248 /NCGR_PEP_ID=MMETSP0014_2-20120614/34041_1 /TAXON_ID=2857 /ORGANISM="Nitzschia sp." /LENGTH=335 /DNA_ID=CAMNT_0000398199 /DNA_START=437 /DNA_END=1444 /DNA_ORIENTATION=- /assembly_acc=CAM_ASM_000159